MKRLLVFSIRKLNNSGLTLIEVLMASVIAGFILITLLTVTVKNMNTEIFNEEHDKANSIYYVMNQRLQHILAAHPDCIDNLIALDIQRDPTNKRDHQHPICLKNEGDFKADDGYRMPAPVGTSCEDDTYYILDHDIPGGESKLDYDYTNIGDQNGIPYIDPTSLDCVNYKDSASVPKNYYYFYIQKPATNNTNRVININGIWAADVLDRSQQYINSSTSY